MSSRKIKNLNLILKNEYDFDDVLEKRIYAYLCFRKIKRNKLPKELQFNYYSEWEGYIKEKYKNYNSNKMEEFSKFLNLKINNLQFDNTYWHLTIPILLTIVTDFIFAIIMKMQSFEIMQLPLWVNIVIIAIPIILSFIIIIMMIVYIFKPLIVNQNDSNFYKDYKEIIDKINNNTIK